MSGSAGLAGGESSSKMARRRAGLPGLGGGEEPRTRVLELEEGAGLGQELSTSGTWRGRSALEGPGTSEVDAASLEEGAGAGGDGGEVGLVELLISGFCSIVKRQVMIKVAETQDYKGTWHQVQVVGL